MNHRPSSPPAGAVVVGIGLEPVEAALAFAAGEARRTHSPLHLVHALRVSGAEAYAGVLQGAVEAADAAVAQSTARARELVAGEVPVTAERIDDGWLVADLVDRARTGRMLVLQHRRLGRLQRLVTGSTVSGVASRCPVPVVSVPEDWRPETDTRPVVTVAVQDATEAESLVRRGLCEAGPRGASVEVLHSWWLSSGYDSVVVDQAVRSEREHEVIEELEPGIAAARRDYPDVPLIVTVRHAPPAEALLDASEVSDLLVIGRRHHLLPLGSHLGPIARAVLRNAAGPVLMEPDVRQDLTTRAPDALAGAIGRPV